MHKKGCFVFSFFASSPYVCEWLVPWWLLSVRKLCNLILLVECLFQYHSMRFSSYSLLLFHWNGYSSHASCYVLFSHNLEPRTFVCYSKRKICTSFLVRCMIMQPHCTDGEEASALPPGKLSKNLLLRCFSIQVDVLLKIAVVIIWFSIPMRGIKFTRIVRMRKSVLSRTIIHLYRGIHCLPA